jgi:ArsR family transcriptional regulator, arsenate/arsenite/antimonite-responsive transcriptional repressor
VTRDDATAVFESLASGLRLDLFRLLVRHSPQGLVAGEISAALEVPPNNLSFHLKSLTHAGLLTVQQEGRFQRYRANVALIHALIDYLTDACCAGQPDLCAELRDTPPCPASKPSPPRKRTA